MEIVVERIAGLDVHKDSVVACVRAPVGELSPLRRHRFVRSETAIALFRQAPRVDLARLRDDLDRVASQDPRPRA
jgi:hypothetical protein